MNRRGRGPTTAGSLDLWHGGAAVVARIIPGVVVPGPPLDAWPFTLLADGRRIPTLPLPAAGDGRRAWQWLQRFVGLSRLGWTFVAAAVLWELFALAFSQRAGWAWDKGAFFFAWGLGLLAFGFFLRRSRRRPAVSRLFLGVNVLVLGVLSLVIATR